jgi:hypothetical protein
VPAAKLGDRKPIGAPVLRAVGHRRAVRPDRRSNPALGSVGQLLARLLGQLHTAAQQGFGLGAVDADGAEALERGLVRRRDGDTCTRLEVVPVRPDDRGGIVEQQSGGP